MMDEMELGKRVVNEVGVVVYKEGVAEDEVGWTWCFVQDAVKMNEEVVVRLLLR